ncbi:MAG: class I SAM-dependent RNA methyltransferase [Candidatus Hydrogenedens sp.]|jgi:23S rRNA (uracil1939-C5)-methyltransferase|nr:class I SAM-dependent RNA methyltransferase [Candidatus Hydrogenedens sp.]
MINELQPGALVEVTVDSVAHGGDGIGRVFGLVVFVTGAFPGDKVLARLTRTGKKAAWSVMEKLITPGPARTEEHASSPLPCTSSCLWHEFAYPYQAEWKCRILSDAVKRIGGIDITVNWLEQPEQRQGYRTRANFHGDGKKLGYYLRRSHEIIEAGSCPSNHPRLSAALAELQQFSHQGNVQVTVNPENDEVLIFLNEGNAKMRAHFPTLNLKSDPKRHSFPFDGVPIVNGCFSQASLILNRLLKDKVDASIGDAQSLLDLYCGSGNFSLHHRDHRKVLGLDQSRQAIDAAKEIAPHSYRRGNENDMKYVLQLNSWDVILLDPPRVGALPIVDALRDSRAERIVYVSCDPATLARDLKILCKTDSWTVQEVTAVDMFPHTPHVEAVALLKRKWSTL